MEEEIKDDSSLWFFDSGASTYITPDFGNLSISSPYEGGDNVTIANGSDMEILNIDSSQINCKDRTLQIKYLLHISTISKNLLSV